jgi:anti-sigma B factor antagonist
LKIQVTEKKPGVFVLTLQGDLDMSTSPQVRDALLPLFGREASHVIIDLSEVPYADSSGIATFVEGLQLSRKHNIRFTLAGATSMVESIFDLAYLKDVFEMVPNVDSVLGEA